MVWHLRFDNTNDYVTIPSALSNSALATTEWTFEFKGIVRAFPVSGRQGILGTISSSFANGFAISSLGQLQIMHGGSVYFSTVADYFKLNELHTYRVHHLANGSSLFYRDGVEVDTAYTIAAADWTSSRVLNRFGVESASNQVSPEIDIEYIAITGLVNSQKWDATLGGSGTTLPTVSGLNQGSFLGTPVWVQYITNKPLKYWDGASWVTKPLKYYNGTSWVEKPLKYHNGTGWS